MKKLRNVVAVLLVMLLAIAILVSCNYFSLQHHHDYSAWGSNENNHWKCCPRDDAIDSTTIAGHVDGNSDRICDVCEYVMSAPGGDSTGGDITGGDTTGGDITGGDTTGGDITGGDTTGGDTTGGDTIGGDSTGGDIIGGTDYNYNYNLADVFKRYETSAGYNFKILYEIYDLLYDETAPYDTYTYSYKDSLTNCIEYSYYGYDCIDYYDGVNNKYYMGDGEGAYYLFDETDADWDDLVLFADACDISTLNDLTFKHFDRTGTSSASEPSPKQNQYVADNAVLAGNTILGEWENDDTQNISWTRVEIYLFEEDIEKIVAYCSGTYVNEGETEEVEEMYVLTFSDFGEIDFDLSELTIVDDSGFDEGDIGDGDDSGSGDIGDGDDSSSGSQGGTTQTSQTYTAEFTDQYLSADCDIEFTTKSKANSMDDNRGVQFLQNAGTVSINTTTSVTNVTKVTLVVASNADKGMKLSVSVGSANLTSSGLATVTIEKQSSFNVLTTVEFVASTGVDGTITITMTPTGNSKSMYIKSVEIVCGGSGSGSSSGSGTSNVMPEQQYDASKHDNSTLREQMEKYYDENGYSDPLPLQSSGSYNCLVVPVQFGSNQISNAQFQRLNDVFNGTSTATGWESVSSYYKKSSYGKLNLTFDISEIFTAKESASYYERYSTTISIDGVEYSKTGDLLILEEVMASLEKSINLTKYDNDNDNVLDAIWLIYSAPVSTEEDSIYWAYVTTYGQDDDEPVKTYDGLELGYYLFAGLDFMDDYTGNANDQKYYSDYTASDRSKYAIDGMITNACTYIHETGHLLGLDDYYDYAQTKGSNVGLGGADMMDNTIGDHCSYSKIMLGWVEPTIVTTTQTVTINSFESSGDVIMLLLDYNGTYFSEYLLIDLYTKTGLNETHGNQYDSLLYYSENTKSGAEYGVRIYHVSSDIDDPYSDDYYSFTTNNNSYSDEALIKLVSADGNGYISNDDYTWDTNLFQTGDTLASYKRNDGKTVNFTISFTSVTASGATVSITF